MDTFTSPKFHWLTFLWSNSYWCCASWYAVELRHIRVDQQSDNTAGVVRGVCWCTHFTVRSLLRHWHGLTQFPTWTHPVTACEEQEIQSGGGSLQHRRCLTNHHQRCVPLFNTTNPKKNVTKDLATQQAVCRKRRCPCWNVGFKVFRCGK
jgi:hypothetical protein